MTNTPSNTSRTLAVQVWLSLVLNVFSKITQILTNSRSYNFHSHSLARFFWLKKFKYSKHYFIVYVHFICAREIKMILNMGELLQYPLSLISSEVDSEGELRGDRRWRSGIHLLHLIVSSKLVPATQRTQSTLRIHRDIPWR